MWEFSYQVIERARVKEAQRIHAKALRRGLDNPDQLLERCYEKDGRNRFPVHDLLGVRVLVLSVNHMAALKQAVENLDTEEGRLYPFGNSEDFGLEDINESPRPGGYRALHIDGSVTVREGETDYTVPFEIQVKTLAQHVYGQHTHDEAYVPDAENEDSRYEFVKGLQAALAEQLNAADLLLAQIEDVAGAGTTSRVAQWAQRSVRQAWLMPSARRPAAFFVSPTPRDCQTSRIARGSTPRRTLSLSSTRLGTKRPLSRKSFGRTVIEVRRTRNWWKTVLVNGPGRQGAD